MPRASSPLRRLNFVWIPMMVAAGAAAWIACAETSGLTGGSAAPDAGDSGRAEVPEAGSTPDDGGTPGDGGTSDDCWTRPFATVAPLPILNSAFDERSFTISLDERNAYVRTNRDDEDAGLPYLYVARRSERAEPFGAPTRLDLDPDVGRALNSVSISPDDRTLIVSGISALDDDHDLFRLARSFDSAFSTAKAQRLDGISTSANEVFPFQAPNGTLYFARTADLGASNVRELLRAPLLPDGGAGEALAVTELTAAAPEATNVAPVVSADGLRIFFASSRPPSVGIDIWYAERATLDEAFAAPKHLDDARLNGGSDARPSFVSEDGCRLYFTSDAEGGLGLRDVWLATR